MSATALPSHPRAVSPASHPAGILLLCRSRAPGTWVGAAPVSRAAQELREEGTGAPCLVFRTAVQTGRSSLPSADPVGSDKDTPMAAALATFSEPMTMGRWSQHSPCPGVSGGCGATHDTSVGLTVGPVSHVAREALPPSRRRPRCPWHRGHTLLMTGARAAPPHQHSPECASHTTSPHREQHVQSKVF